jgi:cell division septation protein DedD
MTLRDAERFKDKIEVSLDSRQIFFLFFGGAVVACLVFVLGVMVGRRLEGREQVARKAATSAAIDPLAALDELGADEKRRQDKHDELAFPQALGGEPEERAKPLGAADVAPAAPPPEELAQAAGAKKAEAAKKAAAAAEEAKKADEAKKAADAAAAKKAAEEAKKADEAKKAADAAAAKKAAEEAKAAEAKEAKEAKEARKAAAAPAVAGAAKPAAASAANGSAAAPKAGKGKYTLQLSSFQDRAEADAFAAKVAAAGYKPYVIQSDVPDRGTFFRVRLGEYGTHEDAIAAKADFEAKQHIIAYVTRL